MQNKLEENRWLYACLLYTSGIFAGAIDLKVLIIAREHDNLQDIISSSYPYVYEHEKISECMERCV